METQALQGQDTKGGRQFGPVVGFLLSLVVLALFLGISWFIWVISMLFIPWPAVLILDFIVAAVFSYAMGWLIPRWGWMVALSYSLLFMAYVPPWMLWGDVGDAYLWFAKAERSRGPLLIAAAVLICLLFSWLGSARNREKGRVKVRLRKPLLSLLPIISVSLVFSLCAPVILSRGTESDKEKVERFPEYGFQVTAPKGWYASIGPGGGFEEIEKDAIAYGVVTSKSSVEKGGLIRIFVYDKMPFTGVPLTSFPSREALYENLRATLQDVAVNPGMYKAEYNERNHRLLYSFRWYGPTEIGGIPAVCFAWWEYREAYGKVEDPPPKFPDKWDYFGSIFVYKEPYLYNLEIYCNRKLPHKDKEERFQPVLDSFKFITPTGTHGSSAPATSPGAKP